MTYQLSAYGSILTVQNGLADAGQELQDSAPKVARLGNDVVQIPVFDTIPVGPQHERAVTLLQASSRCHGHLSGGVVTSVLRRDLENSQDFEH